LFHFLLLLALRQVITSRSVPIDLIYNFPITCETRSDRRDGSWFVFTHVYFLQRLEGRLEGRPEVMIVMKLTKIMPGLIRHGMKNGGLSE
jgi:hypothetical protein